MKSLFLPLVRLRPHPHHAAAAAALRWSSTFHPSAPAPSPPRLPAKEQAEFERLQKLATSQILSEETPTTAAAAEERLPQIPTRMPAPEFEGDKNPRTGEVNGPKSEPLRWGSKGDWSYNGRVTDF